MKAMLSRRVSIAGDSAGFGDRADHPGFEDLEIRHNALPGPRNWPFRHRRSSLPGRVVDVFPGKVANRCAGLEIGSGTRGRRSSGLKSYILRAAQMQ